MAASADGGMHPTHQFTGTAATHHGDHVIGVPDDAPTTVEEHGEQQSRCKMCMESVILQTLAVLVVVYIVVNVSYGFLNLPAEYSAAVSAIADDGLGAPPPRSVSVTGRNESLGVPALLSLTVRVRNPGRVRRECVARGSAAWVRYNGTVIAAGYVPPFCAGKRREEEVVAPLMWLPPPGKMQRAGAVVDLAIWMTRYNRTMGCRVKVGGGLSACCF